MKFSLSYLAAFTFPTILLFAESKEVPEIPTRTEADSIVATQEQAREHREAERKAAIEEIPASEEWKVDHGNRQTILRRVAPPPAKVTIRESESTDEATIEPKWTEEEIAAWIAAQPVPRTLNLSAVVYDHSFTKITWREQESGEEWTVLSNIDFRYLSGIGSFEDKNHYWQTFLFVDEIDSEKEKEIAPLAHTLQMQGESQIASPTGDALRTADLWLNILPSDFLPTSPLHDSSTPPPPEYLIIADAPETAIPAALYEELDALHQHYHANEERLIAEYERRKVINEARRAYREANPPEPKDTVINFWRAE